MPARPGPESHPSRRTPKRSIAFATIVARTGFWLVCIHYFGSDALFHLIAAWAFVSGVRDATFARVRLADVLNPAKRRSALIASVLLESGLTALRILLILGLARLLQPYSSAVSTLTAGLALCALFWGRDTLVMLTRAREVGRLTRYVRLASALTGLMALLLLAESDLDPVTSTVAALVLREAVLFFGFVALVGMARALPAGWRSDPGQADDDEADELDIDGPKARTAFQDFLADNAVHARWRIVQVGARAMAQGLLGPFGSIASQFVFSLKKPGPYRPRERRRPAWHGILVAGAAVLFILLVIWLAGRWGFLGLLGIVAAGVAFRVLALAGNLLFWWQLNARLGAR